MSAPGDGDTLTADELASLRRDLARIADTLHDVAFALAKMGGAE